MSEQSPNDPGGDPGAIDGAAAPSEDSDVPPPPPPPPPSPDLIRYDPTAAPDDVPSGEAPPPPPPYEEAAPPPPPAPGYDEVAPPPPAEGGDVPWQVPNPTPPWPAAPPGAPDPMAPPPAPAPVSPAGGWPAAPAPPPPAAYQQPAPGYGAPPPPQMGPPGAPGYPAPGYPQQPGHPGVMAPQPPMPQYIDPHGVGQAAARLGSGGRRTGKVAFLLLAAVLEPEDVVEIVVSGRLHGYNAAAALAGSKLVLVNDREWKPEVVVLPIGPALQVQGWQDDRAATLLFQDGERQEVVERIPDRLLAIEFAQRVRDRVAAVAAQGSGEYPAAPATAPAPPQPGTP